MNQFLRMLPIIALNIYMQHKANKERAEARKKQLAEAIVEMFIELNHRGKAVNSHLHLDSIIGGSLASGSFDATEEEIGVMSESLQFAMNMAQNDYMSLLGIMENAFQEFDQMVASCKPDRC